MTLNWIISRLKISGRGTKQEVLNALENISKEELIEFRRNINEHINLKIAEEYYANRSNKQTNG